MSRYVVQLLLIFCISCKTEQSEVVFSGDFPGGRLNGVVKEGESYRVSIEPAHEPVNESPYFAFSVVSSKPRQVRVILDYGAYKHRYIPKVSFDRNEWFPLNKKMVKADPVTGDAILLINVSTTPSYIAAQEITTVEDSRRWLDDLPSLEIDTIGRSVMGKPLLVVNSNKKRKRAVVLIARQHPPEIPGGTFSFRAFLETLLQSSSAATKFMEEYNIISFPMPNPDGVDMGYWRHNANGVDLNRDWTAFTQPETQAIKNYLEVQVKEGVEIKFAIDFHTSYSGPYLLTLDSLNQINSSKITSKWLSAIEQNSPFNVEERKRSQQLPYCYNYFFNQFGAEAVTYEEGDEIERGQIRKRAAAYAKELINVLNED